MKKSIAIIFSAIVLMMSNAAMAADDVATIINVAPIQGEQPMQQQVCGPAVGVGQVAQERSSAGSILGGIVGAVIGSHAGNGNGRLAATAGGAILGAVAGDRIDNRQPIQAGMQQMPQQTCRFVMTSVPRIVGYMVSYEFNGRNYQSMMQYDPSQGGNTSLRVSVSVLPK